MEKEIVILDGVRIVNRNFTGTQNKYNRAGERNFCVVLEDAEIAQNLAEDGYNVKIKAPREEGDLPFTFLQIKVKFNPEHPRLNPKIWLRTGKSMNLIEEDGLAILDEVEIENVDMEIRPYTWDVKGETGVSAYLVSMCITQHVDRYQNRYDTEE